MSNVAFGAVCKVGELRPAMIPTLMQKLVAPGVGRIRRVSRSDHVYTSPRLVRFSEMEYAIPRENGREAIEGIRKLIDANDFNINFPIEVRFVAPDDILLSPGARPRRRATSPSTCTRGWTTVRTSARSRS